MDHLGRILVVDPDPVASEVVQRECARLRRTMVMRGTAEAEQQLERDLKLTALVVEYELADGDGLEVLKAYRAVFPRLPVLMLTAVTAPKLINRCHLYRADFVAKPARRRNVRAFLQRAVAFERVPDSRISFVVEDVVRTYGLSPRETDVLAAAIQGVPRKTIADQIGTTENTIKSCVKSLLRKCDSSSLDEVARGIWLDALKGSDAEELDPQRGSHPPGTPFTIPPPLSTRPSSPEEEPRDAAANRQSGRVRKPHES